MASDTGTLRRDRLLVQDLCRDVAVAAVNRRRARATRWRVGRNPAARSARRHRAGVVSVGILCVPGGDLTSVLTMVDNLREI